MLSHFIKPLFDKLLDIQVALEATTITDIYQGLEVFTSTQTSPQDGTPAAMYLLEWEGDDEARMMESLTALLVAKFVTSHGHNEDMLSRVRDRVTYALRENRHGFTVYEVIYEAIVIVSGWLNTDTNRRHYEVIIGTGDRAICLLLEAVETFAEEFEATCAADHEDVVTVH